MSDEDRQVEAKKVSRSTMLNNQPRKYFTQRKIEERTAAQAKQTEILELHENPANCVASIANELSLTMYGVRCVLRDSGRRPRALPALKRIAKKETCAARRAESQRRGRAARKAISDRFAARRRELVKLYESGLALSVIAQQAGVSWQRVQQIVKGSGATMRPAMRPRSEVKRFYCQMCGAEYRVKRHKPGVYQSVKYCSRKCGAKAKGQTVKGSATRPAGS